MRRQRLKKDVDGVESMDYMENMMREHISSTRIHYVITNGVKHPT